MLVLLVGSGCTVSNGPNSLLSISRSDVRYGTNGDDWIGCENGHRLRALTSIRRVWTLSRRTVYGFSVPVLVSSISGDADIFVKSVTSLW